MFMPSNKWQIPNVVGKILKKYTVTAMLLSIVHCDDNCCLKCQIDMKIWD